jgi:hypothetical protein
MKVFVLTFDSYFDSYGSLLNLIGVFQSKDKVKAAIEQTKAKYSKTINEYRDHARYYDGMSDSEIEKEINEHFVVKSVEVDKVINRNLGGYVE